MTEFWINWNNLEFRNRVKDFAPVQDGQVNQMKAAWFETEVTVFVTQSFAKISLIHPYLKIIRYGIAIKQ